VAVDDPIPDGQRMLGYVKRVDMDGIDAGLAAPGHDPTRDPRPAVARGARERRISLIGLLTPTRPPAAPAPAPRPAAAAHPARADPPTERCPSSRWASWRSRKGSYRFVDRTTKPAFTEEASRIALNGRGLTTARTGKGQLTLAGRLTGGAPFELKGTMGGLGGPINLDLEGKLTDFPLPRVNPYANQLIAGRGAAPSAPPSATGGRRRAHRQQRHRARRPDFARRRSATGCATGSASARHADRPAQNAKGRCVYRCRSPATWPPAS
jgi:hypothetical protein